MDQIGTACGIDAPFVMPNLCRLCKRGGCYLNQNIGIALPPIKDPSPDIPAEPLPENENPSLESMSEKEIDAAFENAEREWKDPPHDLRAPIQGKDLWSCRVCGQLWKSYDRPKNLGSCPGPKEPEPEPEPKDYSALLKSFPENGAFEDNIYRPSAAELFAAMPGWDLALEKGQLILLRELGKGSRVKVYSSILIGHIAGETGQDSIRVVREDSTQDGRTFYYKNPQHWVNRRVPANIDTPEQAAAWIAQKIEGQVEQFSRKCQSCGKLQIKCRKGKEFFWKGLEGCNHR